MKLFLTAAIALAATLAAQAQSNTWFTGSNNQTQTIDLTTFGTPTLPTATKTATRAETAR